MRKDTEIKNQQASGMNINFVQFKEKGLLSLSCSKKQQQHHNLINLKSYVSPIVRDWASCSSDELISSLP